MSISAPYFLAHALINAVCDQYLARAEIQRAEPGYIFLAAPQDSPTGMQSVAASLTARLKHGCYSEAVNTVDISGSDMSPAVSQVVLIGIAYVLPI